MGSNCLTGMCLCLQGYNFYTWCGPWYIASVKSLRSVLSGALFLISLIIPAPIGSKHLHSFIASGVFPAVDSYLARAWAVNQDRQDKLWPLGKGVLASARIGGNRRFLEEGNPGRVRGWGSCWQAEALYTVQQIALKGKGLPLQNVIRILSSVWHSLLVEILMWRSFRTVLRPKADCQWEKNGSFKKTQ